MLPENLRRHVTWLDEEVGILPAAPGLAEPEQPRPGPRRGPRPARAEGPPPGPPWPMSHSLVVDDGDVLLVNAGIPADLAEAFAPEVDVLLLTHTHVDHTLRAGRFERVWAPAAESEALASADGFCHVHGVQRADRNVVREWLANEDYEPVSVARAYQPGGVVRLASTSWHMITIPGLSPGYTMMYEPERRILYAPAIEGISHGVAAPFYGFPSSDLEGVEALIERLGEFEIAQLAGSLAPVRKRGIWHLLKALPLKLRERETRVLEAFEKPASIAEITERGVIGARQVREGKPVAIAEYWERTMADKHVANLLERDLIAARQDGRFERV